MPQGGFLNERQQGGFLDTAVPTTAPSTPGFIIPVPSVKVDSNYFHSHEQFRMPRRRYRNVTTVEIDIETDASRYDGHHEEASVVLGPFDSNQTASIQVAKQVLEAVGGYGGGSYGTWDADEEDSFGALLTQYGMDNDWPTDDNDEYFAPSGGVRIVQWDERGLPVGTIL